MTGLRLQRVEEPFRRPGGFAGLGGGEGVDGVAGDDGPTGGASSGQFRGPNTYLLFLAGGPSGAMGVVQRVGACDGPGGR